MNNYICPICGNTDSKYIGFKNEKPYCRKCITFRGQEATGEYTQLDSAEWTLKYELSDDQKRLSKQLLENFQDRKSTRLNSSHITRSRMPSSA